MRFSDEYFHPASFERVWEMYEDASFTHLRFAEANLEDLRVSVSGSAGSLTISVTGRLPASALPARARGFIPAGLTLEVVERWRKHQDSASGHLSALAIEAPFRLLADCKLSGSGADQTKRRMSGSLQVNVPFFGTAVEKEALTLIPVLREAELAAVKQWLQES